VAVVGIDNYSPNEIPDALWRSGLSRFPGHRGGRREVWRQTEWRRLAAPNTISNFQFQVMPCNDRVKAEVIFQTSAKN